MKIENHRFLYNAAANFAVMDFWREKYEEKYMDKLDSFANLLMTDTEDGIDMLCFVLAEESRQAEAYRKYIGQSAAKPLEYEALKLRIKPLDIPKARELALKAVTLGLQRYDDENDDEEIDLTLLEIEKKTENG